jgi:hypothetical protein
LSSSEISLQSCSDLQIVEGGSHYQKEDMQRPFDLQLKQQEEVFLCGFHDPFVDYMEFSSTSNDKLFFLSEGWLCFTFPFHFDMLWVSLFVRTRSRVSPIRKILVWLHWKHVFT